MSALWADGRHVLPKPCRCGHVVFDHQHHRAGSDCAHCACARFRRVRRWGAR